MSNMDESLILNEDDDPIESLSALLGISDGPTEPLCLPTVASITSLTPAAFAYVGDAVSSVGDTLGEWHVTSIVTVANDPSESPRDLAERDGVKEAQVPRGVLHFEDFRRMLKPGQAVAVMDVDDDGDARIAIFEKSSDRSSRHAAQRTRKAQRAKRARKATH